MWEDLKLTLYPVVFHNTLTTNVVECLSQPLPQKRPLEENESGIFHAYTALKLFTMEMNYDEGVSTLSRSEKAPEVNMANIIPGPSPVRLLHPTQAKCY